MDYMLSFFGQNIGEGNKRCRKFLMENRDLISQTESNTYPELKPMFNVGNERDFIKEIDGYLTEKFLQMEIGKIGNKKKFESLQEDYKLYLLKYVCFCNKNLSIIVTIDKNLKKNHKVLEIDVNEKMVDMIDLQIHFMRDSFEDFKQYIFNNQEKYAKYGFKKFKEMDDKKTKKLRVYIVSDKEVEKGVFFQSIGFFELVESAKIFLHYTNYEFYDNWTNITLTENLDELFRIFFRIRFFKFFQYKHLTLLEQEYNLITGSFLLFSLGLRYSRDMDIYILRKEKIGYIKSNEIECNYDLHYIFESELDFFFWEKIILNPLENYYIYGLKTNKVDTEIFKRKSRHNNFNSRKALADYIVLKYLVNEDVEKNINKEHALKYKYQSIKNIILQ